MTLNSEGNILKNIPKPIKINELVNTKPEEEGVRTDEHVKFVDQPRYQFKKQKSALNFLLLFIPRCDTDVLWDPQQL